MDKITLPFTLYRLYDKNEELLYIGKTINISMRISQHRYSKSWWEEVRSIGLTHFDSISELSRAERIAIKSEDPLYNRVKYNVHIPVARPRQFEAACEWLLNYFEPGIYVLFDDIYNDFAKAGFKLRTIQKAKSELGIASVHDGHTGKWSWYLE